MKPVPLVIGGQAVGADDAFDVLNPSTATVYARCARADTDHVDRAVAAARDASADWRALPDERRAEFCMQLAELLEANAEALTECIVAETGKPIAGYSGVGARKEIQGAIGWARATAKLALADEILQDEHTARVVLRRKALGVVGSITPWNWPLMIGIWHVLPALRAGNTVVMKPSELAPVASSRFAELAARVLPPGVLNLVNGFGDVGAALALHKDVNKIVFTGSTATGRRIMRAGADNLKRLTLELGGNDAGIVLPDVDVRAIASKLFAACFHNNGQTCAALKRLYVHESVIDALESELAAIADGIRLGDPMHPETDLGPVQNAAQLAIIEDLAADAQTAGGRFLSGGRRLDRPGYFFPPTIVTGLSNGARLVDEEPFGPIVPLVRFGTEDEAIALANDSDSGLGGSVWSKDVERARALGERLECGSVWINGHGGLQPHVPFGGIKQSGFGVTFGVEGLREFTSVQTLRINAG
ncbi:MAG: aldehyde dehydrogenase family protein [Pseudomonadota bacterium]